MAYEHAGQHMTDDHQDALVAIAQAFGSVPDATGARVTAMDDAGMDLEVDVADGATRHTRVPFQDPITPDTVRQRMVELTAQARQALGKVQ